MTVEATILRHTVDMTRFPSASQLAAMEDAGEPAAGFALVPAAATAQPQPDAPAVVPGASFWTTVAIAAAVSVGMFRILSKITTGPR
jgi:hypothetical protein